MDRTTKRLRIRNLIPEDLPDMISLWTDPSVQKGMGNFGPRTEPEVAAWLQKVMNLNNTDRRHHACGILESDSRRVVGWIGFGGAPDTSIGELDFGYSMLPAFAGRGYATEALRSVITFCFDDLDVESFYGETDLDNHASLRVMEKVGMRRVGLSDKGLAIFVIRPSDMAR